MGCSEAVAVENFLPLKENGNPALNSNKGEKSLFEDLKDPTDERFLPNIENSFVDCCALDPVSEV